jgi:hypothetical protein
VLPSVDQLLDELARGVEDVVADPAVMRRSWVPLARCTARSSERSIPQV